jgi:hypothetical protein
VIRLQPLLAAATLAVLTSAAWGETATTVSAVELKKSPAVDAETIARLPADTRVEVLKTQGAWKAVKTDSAQGWVRMMALRMGEGAKPGAAGAAAGLGGLLNIARTGSSGNTVSTGAKGITEENLKNAQPNLAELKKLQQLGASPAEARGFARAGGLGARDVAYLTPAAAGSNRNAANPANDSPWGTPTW